MDIYKTNEASRQILYYVTRGYTRYIDGTVNLQKAERVFEKFRNLYYCNADAIFNKKLRRHQQARSKLILYPKLGDPQTLNWILLFTHGKTIATEKERLLDAKNKHERIRIHDLELVQIPNRFGPVSWSYRLAKDQFKDILSKSKRLASHASPRPAQKQIEFLKSYPGWRGVREQRRIIFKSMRNTRLRQKKKDDLVFPKRQPWMKVTSQKSAVNKITMEIYIARLKIGRSPFD